MANNGRDILSQHDSESPLASELRRIYQNMIVGKSGERASSFLFTSALGGEGKSTVVSNIAVTIAQYRSKKVLVVDGDVRRPRIHTLFGLEREGGLYECLVQGADPMQMTKKTRLGNLDILTAGTMTDVPSQMFESNDLSHFFEKVQFYYDIVLVDSPPVLAVTDTLFLCEPVNNVIFVVMAGITPREVVQRAMRVLRDAETNVLGAVVNNAARRLPYYYEPKYYTSWYASD